MTIRGARHEDVDTIVLLIEHYADEGLLLVRSREEICADINRFLVALDGENIVGCVSLENYGRDLAEIRSVAVNPSARGQGVGKKLLHASVMEAKRRGYRRVFAMTDARGFFLRHGFEPVERGTLPEKIERDCAHCSRARDCRLTAVSAPLSEDDAVSRVLSWEVATPVSR